jgi:ribosomal-protein-alanine N-acetyltransferase
MTSSEVSLRLARLPDAARIASMSRALVEYGLQWSWGPERVAACIRDPDAYVLVARVSAETAGFAIMHFGDDEAHLALLAVAPKYRRSGVGRRLLAWLEKCAVVGGIDRILLEVRAGNRGAQAFSESMGYRKLASLPGYYQGREVAVRMGRELGRRVRGSLGTEP